LAIAVILLGVVGMTVWASRVGLGLPQPEKEPPSIREGSARIEQAGHHRTRYFVGGGILRGK
jgi:hypothetical protein